MEEKLSAKANAVELLDKQLALRARKNQYGFIVLSSATDPYLHFEEEAGLTRKILEVILKHRFPVHIITRSDLVLRDFDLLHDIDRHAILPDDLRATLNRGAIVTFSFSTLDAHIARIFEPGATPPSVRLRAHEHAIREGFLSGISMMPMLPYITDTTESLNVMFSAFQRTGSQYVMPATITLFGTGVSDSRTLVFRAIDKHFPHLSDKYRKLFAAGSGLPEYYRNAFGKKMEEMKERFGIRSGII
jgi:DNA repair photolyase